MGNFSETIKRIREQKGMSQSEFAQFLGVYKQNISRWEMGDRSPKITTAAAIAEKLGITIQELNGDPAPEIDSDEELWDLREQMRNNPDTRALFSLAKSARPEDIKAAIAVLEALKGGRQ